MCSEYLSQINTGRLSSRIAIAALHCLPSIDVAYTVQLLNSLQVLCTAHRLLMLRGVRLRPTILSSSGGIAPKLNNIVEVRSSVLAHGALIVETQLSPGGDLVWIT